MISILIPVYNYNISDLVKELHKQALDCNINFEIICFDDNSEKYVIENRHAVKTLKNAIYVNSKVNIGRTAARQQLCNYSKNNWLLYLDADVLPKSNSFIQNYIDNLSSGYDAFFGGFTYSNKQPKTESILRWRYGKRFEEVNANKRNNKPYQLIISANFLIKKEVFNSINSKIKRKSYGVDNYFASLLKQKNIKVLHINNEVYHLGLENNKTYLKKTEEAITTLLWAFNEKKMPIHDQKLLTIFEELKRIRANYIMAFLFKSFKPIIKKNLLGSLPNLYLLQVYKLLYICHKDLNKKAV